MRPTQEGNSRAGDVDVDPALRILLVRVLRLEKELVEFGSISCEQPVGERRKHRVSQFCAAKTEPANERDVRHAQPLVPVPIPDVALRLRAGDGHLGALEPHVVRAIWY